LSSLVAQPPSLSSSSSSSSGPVNIFVQVARPRPIPRAKFATVEEETWECMKCKNINPESAVNCSSCGF
jgi:hypothetical protein